ncbi:MAG: adenylate kinase [Bacteroidales bacterium]|jgi:adenylate kinase|nr:adenylate kinase [Bacteroidales bacterium]MCK9498875.1 adenylate kinase [Bacteroidales bacterium]MDY0315217.1 adenylate kinase [Bacteroidales bacterium]NLB85971.1 adenylate kinase [Bacteroidales bacterium]
MLNIALFGPPGAGKGTQAKMLAEKYNLTYISTGDILRNEIANNTELGLKAKSIIEQGGLVSDEIIVQIIENSIKMQPDTNGILFDGFPRTYTQAYILDGLLIKMNTKLSCLISLEVPREALINRMMLRAEKEKRADDKKEIIENRLREYDNKTIPVIDFYKQQDKFHDIDGIGEINEVFGRVTDKIEEILSQTLLNVVFLGPPGAGKGTQAKRIAEKFNMKYISTGEMIRKEIENQTELGKIAKPYLETGDFVPDDIAIRLLEREICNTCSGTGYLFKGFPSTLVQAYILGGLLKKQDSSISLVVEIKTSTLQSIKRLTKRAKTYKARIYDMNPETIIYRLENYEEKSHRIIDFYQQQNKIVSFDGHQNEDTLFEQISDTVEKAFKEIRK